MIKQPVEEQNILDYILGVLPEAEAERLDELSLIDDEFAARLDAAENDLVDAYVRGELSGKALAGFQSHYLKSPRRQQKVAFARAFPAVLENQRPLPSNKVTWKPEPLKTRGWFHFWSPQWGFAAALLLLSLGAYLMMENGRLRDQVSQRQAEQRELQERERQLQGELAEQRSSSQETRDELERVQQRLAQLEQQPDEKIPDGQQDVQLIALNLAPQTRGISRIPSISVPAGTDFLAINLELEVKDFPAYKAALKDPRTGEVRWTSNKVKYDGTSNSIIIALPASVVKVQNYVLELSGIPRSGASEVVSTYPFRALME